MRLAVIILCFFILGFSQTIYKLEPVVVTATRYPQNIMDITRTITIIDSSEISKYSSLPEMLKGIAGIDMKIRGDGIQADPSLRGSTFQQVLIMINGMRMNDPQTGHHNLNIPIPLHEIKRIEILHGAASSLYGSDACGGVINIITKRQAGIAGNIAYGSFGYKNGAARLATNNAALNFEMKLSDGHKKGYEYSLYNIATALRPDFSNSFKIALRAGYLHKDFGAKNFYAPYPSWEKNQAFFIDVNNHWFISPNIMLNPTILFRTHIDTFVLDRDDPAFYANRHQSFTYGGQLMCHFDLDELGYYIAGSEIFRDSINSTGLGQRQVQHSAFFLQGEKKFLNNNFVLVAGIRDDIYSNCGSSINPHFSLAFHLSPSLKLRGSSGSSFRVPSFTELYYQSPGNHGDSLLQPEHASEYELGADLYTKSFISTISVFYRKTKMNIDWVRRSNETIWQVQNIGRNQFYGCQASLVVSPNPWLRLRTSLANTYITEGLPPGYTSKYVLQVPRVTFSSGLRVFSLLDVSARWLLYNEGATFGEDGNSQVFVDGLLKKELYIMAKMKLTPAILVTNILNRKYGDYQDVPLPGRSIRIHLAISKS